MLRAVKNSPSPNRLGSGTSGTACRHAGQADCRCGAALRRARLHQRHGAGDRRGRRRELVARRLLLPRQGRAAVGGVSAALQQPQCRTSEAARPRQAKRPRARGGDRSVRPPGPGGDSDGARRNELQPAARHPRGGRLGAAQPAGRRQLRHVEPDVRGRAPAAACRTSRPTRFSGASTSCSGRSTTRSPARSGSRPSRKDAATPATSRTRSSTSCRSSPPRSGRRWKGEGRRQESEREREVERDMNDSRAVLVFSAHAADFVWRAGGAIALYASRGYRVRILCLSYGERGESQGAWKEPGMTWSASRRSVAPNRSAPPVCSAPRSGSSTRATIRCGQRTRSSRRWSRNTGRAGRTWS